MSRPALRVKVSQKEQAALKTFLGGGGEQVRVVMRAVALLRLAEGMAAPRVAEVLPLTRQSVRNLARRYEQDGPSNGRSTISNGPAPRTCFRPTSVSASSPWSAAIRRGAARAGRCGSSPKKPSSAEVRIGSHLSTTLAAAAAPAQIETSSSAPIPPAATARSAVESTTPNRSD